MTVWNENAPVDAVGRPEIGREDLDAHPLSPDLEKFRSCRGDGMIYLRENSDQKNKNPWHKVVFDAAPKSFENDWKS